MVKDESSASSLELEYISKCCLLILTRKYEEALSILRDGLEQNLKSADQIEVGKLIKRLQSLVEAIEISLEKDFGVIWRKKASQNDLPNNLPEPCCSFCAKKRSAVSKIIAGHGGYICNECVEVCLQILAESDDGE